MTEKNYRVTGMTCSACAASVQKAVAGLDGVHQANVNIASEKLYVKFDSTKTDFDTIKKAVEDAGYGLIGEQSTKTVELLMTVRTCAACSGAVERATRKLEGVQSAQVNLMTNRGTFIRPFSNKAVGNKGGHRKGRLYAPGHCSRSRGGP